MRKKIAVVLFNLGGPDSLESVRPFLFNLFHDRHIITLPQPFRYIIAKLISTLRAKKSQAIYEQIGGSSTILEETEEQTTKLQKYLNLNCSVNNQFKYDVIPMMRYWHPMTREVMFKVKNGKYDHVVLLPLYPQFSTTTTLSSLREWFENAKNMPLTTQICCYYTHPGFIDAYTFLIHETLSQIRTQKRIRILFSAHSIPQYISDRGDPYKFQVEHTVKAILTRSNLDKMENIRHTICYQSKVGRMKWLGPDIHSQILKAAEKDEVIVIVPISFTSEHSETLVELDIEYAKLAKSLGVEFHRVSTLRTTPLFIKTLAHLTATSLQREYPEIMKESQLAPYNEVRHEMDCGAVLCCKRVNLD